MRRAARRREARLDGFRDALMIGRPDPTRLDDDEPSYYERGFDEGKIAESRLKRICTDTRPVESTTSGPEVTTEVQRWAVLVPPPGAAAPAEYLELGVMTGTVAEVRSRLDRAVLRPWPEIP